MSMYDPAHVTAAFINVGVKLDLSRRSDPSRAGNEIAFKIDQDEISRLDVFQGLVFISAPFDQDLVGSWDASACVADRRSDASANSGGGKNFARCRNLFSQSGLYFIHSLTPSQSQN